MAAPSAPLQLGPCEAHDRRIRLLQEADADRRAARLVSHGQRKAQVRDGRRPPRLAAPRGPIRFVSANPLCAAALKDELEHGVAFAEADFVGVQEHRTRGLYREGLAKWLQQKQ